MSDPNSHHSPRPGPSWRIAGQVAVVVPAAGLGLRLGDQGPKALVRLAGRPMLAWTLADLQTCSCVAAIVVVTHPDAVAAVRRLADAEGFTKVSAVVAGGATRQQSVAAGLNAVPPDCHYVAVHDAARPLAGPGLLDELMALLVDAESVSGVVPGAPVTDTIREIDDAGRSKGIVDRERLRGMQTPQLFVREVLERAHKLALRDGIEAADEATLVERAGEHIRVVPGLVENLKVTTPLDLVVAEAMLARGAGRGASPPGPGPTGRPEAGPARA